MNHITCSRFKRISFRTSCWIVLAFVFFLESGPSIARPDTSDLVKSAGLASQGLSEVKETGFYKLNSLLHKKWPEIEKKLAEIKFIGIKRVLDVLSAVATDVKSMPEIGDSLGEGQMPEPELRDLMLVMMDKYGVEDISTASSIMEKKTPSDRDIRFLMIQFKKILSLQRRGAELYIKIRKWMSGNEKVSDLFDSREGYKEWLKSNEQRMKAFEKLSSAIKRYEESF